MKKIILTALLAAYSVAAKAQETIRIPDVALEEALIDLKIDTNGLNGTILVSDAEYVVDLNIFNPLDNKDLPNVHSKIKSLSGIEHFPNLRKLVCYGNEIKNIDVSKNKELTFLNCSENNITKIDISKNNKLRFLSCDTNKISKLIIGNNTSIEELYCSDNKLKKINIQNANQLQSIDVSGNSNLEILINSKNISSIPENWYKDNNASYVTSFSEKKTTSK